MALTDYLDGDPNGEVGIMADLTPFAAGVYQNAQFLLDLLESGRTDDAIEVAVLMKHRAESVLRDTETPFLPAVDSERTEDVIRGRRYKS